MRLIFSTQLLALDNSLGISGHFKRSRAARRMAAVSWASQIHAWQWSWIIALCESNVAIKKYKMNQQDDILLTSVNNMFAGEIIKYKVRMDS